MFGSELKFWGEMWKH